LRAAHVGGEFAREGGKVHVVTGCAPEDLGIGHPAQALVALAGSRWQAYEV